MKKTTTENSEVKIDRCEGQRRFSKRVVVLLTSAIVLASVSAVIGVFAWFAATDSSANVTVTVSDFTIIPYIYNDGEWVEMENGVTASCFDPYASAGSPRINLKVSGHGHCYVRVKVFESYFDLSGDLLPVSMVPITFNYDSAKWTYNPSDGYYYYKSIVKEPTPSGDAGIPFLNGIVSPSADPDKDDTIKCCVAVLAEAVQPDRMAAFFGSDLIPWIELSDDNLGDVTVDTDDELIID